MTLPPTFNDLYEKSSSSIDPIEKLPFFLIDRQEWRQAKLISLEIEKISKGKDTHQLSKYSGTIGKLGELIYKKFGEEYFTLPFKSFATVVYKDKGDSGDCIHDDKIIDIKTRHLIKDHKIPLNFSVMIPVKERSKQIDIFVGMAYCIKSHYGYVLGWITAAEAESYDITNELKYPARKVPFGTLHPIETLENYLKGQNYEN